MTERPFLEININELEKEWVEQVRLYDRHSRLSADIKKNHAECKAELEAVEAEVKRAIRRNPHKYGITKLTDKPVEEAMLLTTKYKEAITRLIEAKHEVDVLDGVLSTLEHRKRALENLVNLYSQNYFSTPRVSSDVSDKLRDAINRESKRETRGGGIDRR